MKQLYGNEGHESPRIFAHTEIEDFTRLDTKDGESTGKYAAQHLRTCSDTYPNRLQIPNTFF